jgi:hypothetical protein
MPPSCLTKIERVPVVSQIGHGRRSVKGSPRDSQTPTRLMELTLHGGEFGSIHVTTDLFKT